MLLAPEKPQAETISAPVLKIFDGDGFLTRIHLPRRDLEFETTVRFGFIDAPEMGQPGGHEAKDFLAKQIWGRCLELSILIKMDTGGIVDRHGRIVAIPYLWQEFIGDPKNRGFFRNIELEMVLNGWAWVLDRYGPDASYLDALSDARRHRRGIWVRNDNIHPWDFKKQIYRQRSRRARNSSDEPELFSSNDRNGRCPIEGCEGNLVRRSGKFGNFYGCSQFPICRHSCSASD